MILHKLNKLFNIQDNEWPRVCAGWTLGFLARVSYIIAWTVVMAIFISRLGVNSLVLLFILNALSIIFGTIIYSELIKKFSTKKVTIGTGIIGGFAFLSSFYLAQNPQLETLFLGLMILSISVFLAQLNILINLFIEELFTPLESERTFPVIESYEVAGGIIGGLLITEFAEFLNLNFFIALIGGILIFTSFLIYYFHRYSKQFPFLDFHHQKIKKKDRTLNITKTWQKIKGISFVKLLAATIILQFILFTLVEYQFAKGIEYELGHEETTPEENLESFKLKSPFQAEHLAASLLSAESNSKLETNIPIEHEGNSHNGSHENDIAHKLGLVIMLASLASLFVQLFLASKIINKLGIIKTMILHPLVLIINSILLTWKFGFITGSNLKIGFEITNGLYLNSYHSSYYSLKEHDRGAIKEFMDGLMKPIGMLIATLILFISYKFIPENFAIQTINLALIITSIAMMIILLKAKHKYTDISLQNLKSPEVDMITKTQAIEILAQNGHANITEHFIAELQKKDIHESIKIKLIETMGYIDSPETLSMLINYLDNKSDRIRFNATKALRIFHENSKQQKNELDKQTLISKLKIKFINENDSDIKLEIIHTLLKLDAKNIQTFLLESLKNSDNPNFIASTIEVCQHLGDKNLSQNLSIYLESKNIRIKANTISALWNLPAYKDKVHDEFDKMFCELNKEILLSAFQIAGEVHAKDKIVFLKNYLKSNDIELRSYSAIALAKLEDHEGIEHIAKLLTHDNNEVACKIKTAVQKLPEKVKDLINRELYLEIHKKSNKLIENHKHKEIAEFPKYILSKLKQYYEIADQFEEAMRIEKLLKA